ncbi:MAG: FimV/HubP family polar landmark protein [Rhodanobacteraceae bacterium]
MKLKLRIACVALLAAAAAPAWALQLGQIQVKSALDQPLVAAIPLHPGNLTELDGLTVGLAPAADYTRAGLQLNPTDRTLQFRVVTDNNGQKLILVTSSQPITDPYLDFLVQVNTRRGKQVREFVVLLNPVIAAPAPVVQSAPVASTPAAPPAEQAEQLPPASAFPQPPVPAAPQPAESPKQAVATPPPLVPALKPMTKPVPKPVVAKPEAVAKAPPSSARQLAPKPAPKRVAAKQKAVAKAPPSSSQRHHAKPAPRHVASKPKAAALTAPTPAARPAATVQVSRGDTLYHIAQQQTQGARFSINQMMIALQTANPDAFSRDNIDNLKAGAILRIPTRDEVDKTGIAEADAEVRRQYESWRASRPHRATVIEGTAAQAAANAAPKSTPTGSASDHLTLAPPTGTGGAANNRPGVAGGTGSETVTGLQQKLQNDRGALISLNQSNADLESRVRSLKDISGKTDKLLSLKDSTIAGLQRKLAQMQSGKAGIAGSAPVATAAVGAGASAGSVAKAAGATPAGTSAASTSAKPVAGKSNAAATPWYERPLAWAIAGLIVLALILFGLLHRRRGGAAAAAAKGPLPGPEDVAPDPDAADDEASLQATLTGHPGDLATHLALCRVYYAQGDKESFIAAAEAMHARVSDPGRAEWREVVRMGEALSPDLPFAALVESHADPYGIVALHQPAGADAAVEQAAAEGHQPQPAAESELVAGGLEPAHAVPDPAPALAEKDATDPGFADDPVDTKLDLARAYLDMGDPVGARAMLEEIIEEGSQAQKDEAKRLLAEVTS